MRQIIQLVKKDFIIIKNFLFLFIFLSFLLPIFLFSKLNKINSQFAIFFLSTVFILYFIINCILTIEEKYCGEIYLSTLPLSKETIAIAPYVFMIIFYFICILDYNILLLLPVKLGLNPLSIKTYILTTFFVIGYFSVYFPILFKFGYEKTKIIFLICIVGLPYILPFIGSMLIKHNIFINIDFLNESTLLIIMCIIILCMFFSSMYISGRIYRNKDF